MLVLRKRFVAVLLLAVGVVVFPGASFAMNEPPRFEVGPDIAVAEDSGPQAFPGWAAAISPGGPAETGQVVRFEVTNKDSTLFAVQPAIDSHGTLTFLPAHGAFGSAVVTVIAVDDGGTDDRGWDTSEAAEFVITILPVNDPPAFEIGASPVVFQDTGPVVITNWAYRFNPGSQFEVGQTLEFRITTETPGLFSAGPAVDRSGTLAFTPAKGAFGTAELTVVATDDGGTERGGIDTSRTLSFTITVLPANRPPEAMIEVLPSSWLSRSDADVVVIANLRGFAEVGLDASGSLDPDGDELAWRWWVDSAVLHATNARIELCLDAGEHEILVHASDGALEDVRAVRIEVIEPEGAIDALADEVVELIPNRGVRIPLLADLKRADRELRRGRPAHASAALVAFEREVRRRTLNRNGLVAHSREIRAALRSTPAR